MATPEEKAAESAKYLNTDYSIPNNQPTWNYWYPGHPVTRASLTGVDGKEYIFIPSDYVEKGRVIDEPEGKLQIFNKTFLNKDTFKNATPYTFPEGVQGVMSNNGYVWPVEEFNKLKLDQYGGYMIGPNDPPLIGLGFPDSSFGLGETLAYITQPKAIDALGGQQRLQQDFITAGGGRQVGYGRYKYYPNNDGFVRITSPAFSLRFGIRIKTWVCNVQACSILLL